MIRFLVAGVFALALPFSALATAVVESLTGTGLAGDIPLSKGQKIVAPTLVTTGPGAQAFLRFEDGMQVVLSENTWLRILDYRHTPNGAADRAVFQHMRGAIRVVTGKIVLTNPTQFFVHTPQTQLNLQRPADFSVAIVNPVYVTVHSGTVLSSNTAGTVALNAGTTSAIASNSVAAATIPASSLPPSAASSMTSLSVASVSAPVGGAATGLAAGAAGGAALGFAAPLVVVGAVVAGVAAAAANDDDNAPGQPSTPTHH